MLIDSPAGAGNWEVWLHGNPGFQNVTLEALTVAPLFNGYAEFGLAKSPDTGATLTNYDAIIYRITIPAGTTRLIVESEADGIMGGGCGRWGDADLYLGFENLDNPHYSVTPACHKERIEVRDPQPGVWLVAVHAKSDFQHVTLRAAWDETLENGIPRREQAQLARNRPIQTGDAFLYRVHVPPDATQLSIEAEVSPTANPQSASLIDVYARAGEMPTPFTFDAMTTAWTHLDAADTLVTSPAPGRWYVEVVPAGQFVGTTFVTVDHDGGSGILQNRVPYGPVCEDGQRAPRVYQFEVPAESDVLSVALSGGSGEADLYLQHGMLQDPQKISDPGNPLHVWEAASAAPGTEETVTVPAPAAGTWSVLAAPDVEFCGVTLTASTSVAPEWAPNPATQVYLWVPSNGPAGDVFPMAASAADSDGDPITYTWDFGDGTTATETLPAGASEVDHRYTSAGSYVVQVTVDDGTGAPAITDQRSVLVSAGAPQPPVITQTVIPATALSNQTVQFHVAATDPAGLALTHSWKFADEQGTAVEYAQGATVSRAFRAPGRWYVEVVVENAAGLQALAQGSVSVQ